MRLGRRSSRRAVKDTARGYLLQQITICHVTNSATNPYVVIEVDLAAFDGEGKNDHAHHERDGRVDVVYDEAYGWVDDSGGNT